MTEPGGALKRSKFKGYISHSFILHWDSCTEFRGMPRGDMRWYIMNYHDFERTEEQLLRPFRGRFVGAP